LASVSALIGIEEATELILERAVRLPSERVPLEAAAGRVLAEPAYAGSDVPPFSTSAMDGFAIRAADAPGPLVVVERVAAGRPASRPLVEGEAMAIATGGAVPAGADAIAPIEVVVQQDNGTIAVPPDVSPGAHVRPRGGDVATGVLVLEAGIELGAAQIGALAATGIDAVEVALRPRVAVLTTGSELRPPGTPLAGGEIYESNGAMLQVALGRAGAVVDLLPAVVDTEVAHREAIAQGLEADVFVSSGGVSVGEHDLVRRVEAELGVAEVFWGVAMRPGKPVSFGVHGRTLVFGLPGNPVSALVGALLFVQPALRAVQGSLEPRPRFQFGALAAPLRRDTRRDTLVRARSRPTASGVELAPVAGQESHMIVRAARADALIHLKRGEGDLPAGSPVPYLRLD
jgi:molybdopterin molybdotransferase